MISFSAEALLDFGREVIDIECAEAKQLSARLDQDFVAACALILKTKGKLIISGIGKSGHIGKKLAATFASTGTPSFFMHPSEALHGDLGMVSKNDVVLLISYSGRASEFNAIIAHLQHLSVPLIALTGGLDSPLAQAAEAVLNIHIDREACPMHLAPTSSSTNTLIMGDALAISVMRARQFNEEDFARSHPAGSLGTKLLCQVKNVMRAGDKIPKINQDKTVLDAMLELSRTGLGLVAICDSNQHILGVFTDGDLRRLLLNQGSLTDNIETVMTQNGHQLHPELKAVEALKKFHEWNITAAPVVDDQHLLIGALNIHDLHDAGIVE